uniref:Uncharacterized protein n=1 Tax=viral metagenome TaxID=1070528 RepID=A0A6C0HL96_9ZZZZ
MSMSTMQNNQIQKQHQQAQQHQPQLPQQPQQSYLKNIAGAYAPSNQNRINETIIDIKYDSTKKNTNSNNYEAISPNNVYHQTKVDLVASRIYKHFTDKYPTAINSCGLSLTTVKTIVDAGFKKNGNLNQPTISSIIDVIDLKLKQAIHSDNRRGVQYDTITQFSMDEKSKITMDKYLENYTNKVTVLNNSDKAIDAQLPSKMAPMNDIVKLQEPDPFSEDFPLKDRILQTDTLVPEIRKFDYYLAIDSKDRNIKQSSAPNNFIIELAPAPSSTSENNKGYIDRAFGNIESCELLNVIIRDTSDQPDSSDTGGINFPYLLLQFDELQQNYFGTNNDLTKTFAILTQYKQKNSSKYKYYRMVGDHSESTVTKVYNPRITLSRITTRLLLPNGELFNFGAAFNDDTSNTVISVTLRISTVQRNLATQFLDKATH